MKILSQFEARLQTVPRWSIVNTIQKQSVAEHSFRVALMVPRIYVLIHGYEAAPAEIARMTRRALLHDQLEAFTGDIPSPAKKPLAINQAYAEAYFDEFIVEKPEGNEEEYIALKVADIIEALYFLHEDVRMGNQTLEWIIEDLWDRLSELIPADLYKRLRHDILQLSPQNPLDTRSPRATQSAIDSNPLL